MESPVSPLSSQVTGWRFHSLILSHEALRPAEFTPGTSSPGSICARTRGMAEKGGSCRPKAARGPHPALYFRNWACPAELPRA